MTDKEVLDSLEILNHKLKNNLHAIGINLDVLKTKLKRLLPQEKDLFKFLEIVSSESQQVTNKIDTYMKYVKLDDNKRQKTNLRKLLEG